MVLHITLNQMTALVLSFFSLVSLKLQTVVIVGHFQTLTLCIFRASDTHRYVHRQKKIAVIDLTKLV